MSPCDPAHSAGASSVLSFSSSPTGRQAWSGAMDMRAKPVPYLNWSSRLFPDVGPAELMAKHDGDPFAEEADIAAEIDIIAPGGVNGAIVRYHYPEHAGCLHA